MCPWKTLRGCIIISFSPFKLHKRRRTSQEKSRSGKKLLTEVTFERLQESLSRLPKSLSQKYLHGRYLGISTVCSRHTSTVCICLVHIRRLRVTQKSLHASMPVQRSSVFQSFQTIYIFKVNQDFCHKMCNLCVSSSTNY